MKRIDPAWTIGELAEAVRVDPETIRRHLHEGTYDIIRVGARISIPDHEARRFIDDHTRRGLPLHQRFRRTGS